MSKRNMVMNDSLDKKCCFMNYLELSISNRMGPSKIKD